MSQQIRRELLSVPNVADGLPATALALSRLAQGSGIRVDNIELNTTSLAARLFHRTLTASSARSNAYTENSETRRSGVSAAVFAKLSAWEFAARAFSVVGEPSARWNVVQEHQLLGASSRLLRCLGIDAVRLVTPDVYPKESGILAAKRHPGTVVSVWNQSAYDMVRERGIEAELTQPYFVHAFRPDLADRPKEGLSVVAKSSGSGMPALWRCALLAGLREQDISWALHTPQGTHSYAGFDDQRDRLTRLTSFYGDVGGNTQVVIGYPSELIGVVAELQQTIPVQMITLPPRGNHEKQNLRFGIDNGVVAGELQMPGTDKKPTWSDLERVGISEIAEVAGTFNGPSLRPDLLGTRSFWEV